VGYHENPSSGSLLTVIVREQGNTELAAGILTSNGIDIEKMFISMKLLALKSCSKRFLKENTVPNSIVLQFKGTYRRTDIWTHTETRTRR
jgi:hypothetical protein